MRILIVGFEQHKYDQQIRRITEKLRSSEIQALDSINLITYIQDGGLNVVTVHSIKMQVDMLKPDAILLLTDDIRASLVTVVVPEDSNKVAEATVPARMMMTMKHAGIPIDVSGGNKKSSITLSYLRTLLCAHGSTIGWIRLPVSSSTPQAQDKGEIINTSTEAVIAALRGMVACTREYTNKWAVDTTVNPSNDSIFENMKKGVENGHIANFCIKNEINESVAPEIRRTSGNTIIDDQDLALLSDDESYHKTDNFIPDHSSDAKDVSNDNVVSDCETAGESESWCSTSEVEDDEDTTYCFAAIPSTMPSTCSTSTGETLVRKMDHQLCSCGYCTTANTRPGSPLEEFFMTAPTTQTTQGTLRRTPSKKKQNKEHVTFSDNVEIKNIPYLSQDLVADHFYSEEEISDFKYELYLIQTGFLVLDDDNDGMDQ